MSRRCWASVWGLRFGVYGSRLQKKQHILANMSFLHVTFVVSQCVVFVQHPTIDNIHSDVHARTPWTTYLSNTADLRIEHVVFHVFVSKHRGFTCEAHTRNNNTRNLPTSQFCV